MIIIYHCPTCENRPVVTTPLLFVRRPIVAQCPYCGTMVEIAGRKRRTELNVNDVMEEVEMILSGSK
jgi:transcription elongation factor Elf1